MSRDAVFFQQFKEITADQVIGNAFSANLPFFYSVKGRSVILEMLDNEFGIGSRETILAFPSL
jgi:hypothetical protein